MDARIPGAWQLLLARQMRDFAAWPASRDRFVDEAACLAAVLLAIGAARGIGIGNVGWAAFSAYMVIRPGLGETLFRAGSRVAGTAAGVLLACLLAPIVLHSAVRTGMALALFGGSCLYLAVLDRRAYGALFAGMAFGMVIIDGMVSPDEALAALARVRFLDVSVGSSAALLVGALAAILQRRPAAAQGRGAAPRRKVLRLWHQAAFMHALQAGIALALIPRVWSAFHIHTLGQSSTTIMAVMMMPLLDAAAPSPPTSRKLKHRFIGCGMGALLATAVLGLGHGAPIVMTIALCCGVLAGRHIENGALGVGYVGTQFALTFLVVLVPDSAAVADVHAGLARLSGIVVGMALLQPVRLLAARRPGWAGGDV